MKLLSTGWFLALVGALAYLGTTFAFFNPDKIGPIKQVVQEEEPEPERLESWAFRNPEFDAMVAELKGEREELRNKEKLLKDLETRLASERQELSSITQSVMAIQRDLTQAVMRIQAEIEKSMVRIRSEEIPNLKKLSKVYSSMSPEGAANILKEETDEEVLKVLFYLKPDQVGPILESMGRLGKTEAARAAQLTERMRKTIESDEGKPKT